jgi:hypothetical protein
MMTETISAEIVRLAVDCGRYEIDLFASLPDTLSTVNRAVIHKLAANAEVEQLPVIGQQGRWAQQVRRATSDIISATPLALSCFKDIDMNYSHNRLHYVFNLHFLAPSSGIP